MTDRYMCIDVETANPDLSSICQIGVLAFNDGPRSVLLDTLINPQDFFDPTNTAIHGIREEDVEDAPTFSVVYADIRRHLEGQIVVSHTCFDRVAVARAAEKNGLPSLGCRWLDSARVVRRAWPRFAKCGYGLANCAAELGIEFRHHEACEDARAAGEIVARAIAETGASVDEWLVRAQLPIGQDPGTSKITRKGNPDGPLAGEVLVFTGALSMPRREAADLAAACGCDVAASVTKKTTLLVVGDQDVRRLVGHERSSKHRKAESLIEAGHEIRILTETDFGRLAQMFGEQAQC
jgi:DNA polymerase-3 subunit epsilon